MRRSPALILSSALLLLAQAISPALATALWGGGDAATAAPAEQRTTVTTGGRWIVLCTASGLRSVFLTADGRVVESEGGGDDVSHGSPTTGLVCPLSVLAGAVLPPPAPTVFDRAILSAPVDFRPGLRAVTEVGTVIGAPLGARAPPTA